MSLLINQLDQHNEGNILATSKYSVDEVIFIRQKEQQVLMDNIQEYYKKNFSYIKLKDLVIDEGDITALKDLIYKYKEKDLIVNLTGGKRINSLTLLELCKDNNITAIYMDIKNKKLYIFKEGVSLVNEIYEDLDIDDIVNASGGQIIEDSSNLCKKKDLIYFSEQIYRNLDLWHKHKNKLYEASIFEHNSENPKRVYIHTKALAKDERVLIDSILIKLKEMNELNYKEEEEKITVDFLNKYLKSFIFKSGTWLEIATNTLINKIKEVDEAKNGVVFLWNNENRTVRNEVDVVAVKDSIPIFISCKDSDKYNEMALNELNVYANKIGGNNVYKILVSTKEPSKVPVRTRAKEMGINIVIFDGDENKFINEIRQIIKK